MTSQKRDTEKKETAATTMRLQHVTVTLDDGTEHQVGIRLEEGQTSEAVKARALDYIQRRRAAQAYVQESDPKKVEARAKEVARITSDVIVQTLLKKAISPKATATYKKDFRAFNKEVRAKTQLTLDEFTERLHEHVSDLVDAAVKQPQVKERITKELELEAATAVLGELVKQDEPENLDDNERQSYWTQMYDEIGEQTIASTLAFYAVGFSRVFLEHLEIEKLTATRLIKWFNEQEASGAFHIGTHPLALEVHKSVLGSDLSTRVKTIRDPTGQEISVRTGIDFEPLKKHTVEYGFAEQEEVLENIQKTLLSVKKHGAALLKVHLDLTNEIYEGSDQPMFYSFSDALERLGYTRDDARRGFHRDVMRSFRERLIALQTHTVASHYTKHNGKEYLTRSALWIVSAYHFSRQETIDFVDDVQTLLRTDDATAYTGVTIQPGPWWKAADMGKYRIAVPRSVLRLSTDGKIETYALQIATFLAVHVRRNQREHAGKKIPIRTGTLLEESGIMDREEFFAIKQTAPAKRVRSYVHDESDELGALPVLRQLEAFDVEVENQEEFFASGRGWKDRFWDSTLLVNVPDLKIAPALSADKRKNASRRKAQR